MKMVVYGTHYSVYWLQVYGRKVLTMTQDFQTMRPCFLVEAPCQLVDPAVEAVRQVVVSRVPIIFPTPTFYMLPRSVVKNAKPMLYLFIEFLH